jgi:hypothetical protein
MRMLTAEDTVRRRWLYLVRIDEDIDGWGHGEEKVAVPCTNR